MRTERGGPGATVFDLFGPDGAFLGEVRLDVDVGPFALAGGRIAGVVTDPELGVMRVHRWTIREQ